MPNTGPYVIADDGALVPIKPYLGGGTGDLGDPYTIAQFPRIGAPGGGGGDPGGGGGGDVPNDWRNATLLDPGEGKVVWGMYSSTGDSLNSLASIWGRDINLTRVYSGNGAILSGVGNAQAALDAGRVPFISVNWKNELLDYVNPSKTAGAARTNIGGTGKTLARFMADGNFDGAAGDGLVDISGGPQNVPGFRALARKVKTFTRGACPTNLVVMTPWHEMENAAESGFGWFKTTQGFLDCRQAWQRMKFIFDDEGVTNVLWGFCGASGVSSWGGSMTNTSSTGFYPGHSYIDMVMWDPYNSAGKIKCGGAQGPGYGNAWINLGNNGDRGDGSTNTLLNKFGQMDWWFSNFAMGGSPLAPGPVYKPVWFGETGTGEYQANDQTNPNKQADIWWDKMISYLQNQIPGVDSPLRGMIYFNNDFNDVTCAGSHRLAGFTGRGVSDVWAAIDEIG